MGGESTAKRPSRLRTITPAPHAQGWKMEMSALEQAGGDLALVLWRILRRVREWAEHPEGERAGVFRFAPDDAYARLSLGCERAPELIEAFGTVAFLLRAPETVPARQLAEACHKVHAWAEARSLLEVAALFAEAAALVEPENPAWANDAGRMCRRAARDERSAMWFQRAYGLAARTREQQEMIRALLGYGTLMKDSGQYPEARHYYEKAATRARYTGRRRQAAEAHHDLLAIAAEMGACAEGERHVRRALDLYPIHHPAIPALAHDWAFLLVRSHHYTLALPLVEAALPRIGLPEVQTVVWGTLARAAAGAHRQDRFEEAELRVSQLVDLHQEFAPSALNGLAEGSWAFRRWDRAEEYATRALETARTRKDGGEERMARSILHSLRARETPPPEARAPNRERMEALVCRFLARLRKWRAPGTEAPGAGTAGKIMREACHQFPEPIVEPPRSAVEEVPTVVLSDLFPLPMVDPPSNCAPSGAVAAGEESPQAASIADRTQAARST